MHHQPVPARTIDAPMEAWQRVAARVHARRLQLRLTADQVAQLAGEGLSTVVLSRIENARQDRYSVRTIAALSRALNWTDDSVERILRGDEPVSTRSMEGVASDIGDAARQRWERRVDARLDELDAAIEAIAEQTGLTGRIAEIRAARARLS